MTRFIAAYDVESAELCLPAVKTLVALHRKYDIPATFFIVGALLEKDGPRYREILEDDPLFDIQTHTWSHQMIKDSPQYGKAVSLEIAEQEIAWGKKWVEDVFEKECIGLRPGCGYENGFADAPQILELLRKYKIEFVSADLRGPQGSIPNDMEQPYTYEADGYTDILEIPGHGWHDNVLKPWGGHSTYFPPVYDFALPLTQPTTVVGVFAQEGRWLEHAVETELGFVSLVQHPWSLARMDPALGTMELLLVRAKQLNMTCTTYLNYYNEIKAM